MPTYGHTHRKLRTAWAQQVATGQVTCARCHRPIAPGTPWDLGHAEDRRTYQGPEHRKCNRSAGQQDTTRINRARNQARRTLRVRW